jgi:outer membrane immunogenic protein
MRRWECALLASFAFAGFGSVAFAADMPVKAPVYKAPITTPVTWTGCYVGGNVGVGWVHGDSSDAVTGTPQGSGTTDGIVGGVQGGCDYQSGQWVFGARGAFDWSSLKSDIVNPTFPNLTGHGESPWLAGLVGRIGYAWQPNWILYAQGGGAWVRTNQSALLTGVGTLLATSNTTRNGWTAGIGTEYMFAPKWSVFVEFDYADFGTKSELFVTPAGAAFGNPVNVKYTAETLLAGINWHILP